MREGGRIALGTLWCMGLLGDSSTLWLLGKKLDHCRRGESSELLRGCLRIC